MTAVELEGNLAISQVGSEIKMGERMGIGTWMSKHLLDSVKELTNQWKERFMPVAENGLMVNMGPGSSEARGNVMTAVELGGNLGISQVGSEIKMGERMRIGARMVQHLLDSVKELTNQRKERFTPVAENGRMVKTGPGCNQE
ncbi:hypothetical protein V6N13_133253 [Hibiscus sabdariffa]